MAATWPRLLISAVLVGANSMATYKQPTKKPNVTVGEEPAKETMRKANVSVANTRSQDYPPMKTSGIVVRGGKAQTKGKMARGPMA